MGYSITPSLPSGLTFSGVTGQVSGTPTALKASTEYTITVDNNGGSATAKVIIGVFSATAVTTDAITNLTSNQAKIAATVTNAGGSSQLTKGVCYGFSLNPTISDSKVQDSNYGAGSFEVILSGLATNSHYYIRAYATNELGTNYGNNIEIRTFMEAPTLNYTGSSDYTINMTMAELSPTVTSIPGYGLPLTPENALISTFAGTGSSGTADGTGTAASFDTMNKIVFDSLGNAYVADGNNNKIRKITPFGVVSTFAGSGSPGSADGIGTAASFNRPFGLAIDASGNLYVTDYDGNKIRKITPSGVVSTLAGSGSQGSVDGTGTAATFYNPSGIAIDPSGNLYVSEYSNRKVRKITPSGVVSTLAGNGSSSSTDGTGTAASFAILFDITYDALTNSLYVTEGGGSQRIRKVTLNGVVTTLAGSSAGYADGTGSAAAFNTPLGIVSDSNGNLYVSDNSNRRVRKVIASTGVVSTIAGNGTNTSTDGVGIAAQFSNPRGIGINRSGELYIAQNFIIRKVTPMGYSITPALPIGLSLDRLTGKISGTPTLASPMTTYSIKAENNGGSATATVSFRVSDAPSLASSVFCGSKTIADLNTYYANTSLVWYISEDATIALEQDYSLTNNTSSYSKLHTLYAATVSNGVESQRTKVEVTINSLFGVSLGSISESFVAINVKKFSIAFSPSGQYKWTVPSGLTVLSANSLGNEITVLIPEGFVSGQGVVTVRVYDSCSESLLSTRTITDAVPALIGTDIGCSSTAVTYTVSAVADAAYNWSLPSGMSINGSSSGNSITVAVADGFISGTVSVSITTPTKTYSASLAVSRVQMPAAISGPANICGITTANYSVPAVSGAISYVWTLPAGMTASGNTTGNSISVSIDNASFSQGTITVRAVGACGNSPVRSLIVSKNIQPGAIRGVQNICTMGTNVITFSGSPLTLSSSMESYMMYACGSINGISTYNWTAPSGASIVYGQGSSVIGVVFDSSFAGGQLSVANGSACSGTPSARTLSLTSASGVIAGPSDLCGLTTGTYSVDAAIGSGFVWTVPSWMSIVSGQGTNSINVAFTNVEQSNSVTVNFSPACGTLTSLSKAIGCAYVSYIESPVCGTTLPGVNTLIIAKSVAGAESYKFTVNDSNSIREYVSATRSFKLTNLAGEILLDTAHNIIVSVKVNGVWYQSAKECVLKTPSLPALVSAQCGFTMSSFDQAITSNVIQGAEAYRFKVTSGEQEVTYETAANSFALLELQGINISAGATYTVSVAVMINGIYSDYGTECAINTPEPLYTQLIDSHCNATLSTIDAYITATAVQKATTYKFKVIGNGTSGEYVSATRQFRLSDVSGLSVSYDDDYQVSVAVGENGVYHPFGSVCVVTTPGVAVTKLVDSQCNATMASYNSFITANSVPLATSYKFKIVGGGIDTEYTSSVQQFKLTDIPNINIVHGASYQISVAVEQNGEMLDYGPACTITTPMLYTQLISAHCNATLASSDAFITANSVTGATTYKFRIVGSGSDVEYISTVRQFKLTDVQGLSPAPGQTYQISVAVGQNGSYHPYGSACTVQTPNILYTQLISAHCNSTLSAFNSYITATAVSSATAYRFRIVGEGVDKEYTSAIRQFRLTDVADLAITYGQTLQISVAVEQESQFQPYGPACTVSTPPAVYTQLIPLHCNSTLSAVNAYITATAVTAATSYKFKVVGDGINTEYISSVRQFKLTDIPNVPIAMGVTYQISVAVGQNGIYHPYGSTCSVTTPDLYTQLISSHCNATLTAMNAYITANSVSGATSYKFRITGNNIATEYISTVRQFRLTDIANVSFAGGTTYQVSVAVGQAGIYNDFGIACAITTPADTAARTSTCLKYPGTLDSSIYFENIEQGDSYRFIVFDGSREYTLESSVLDFILSEVPELEVQYDMEYKVSISVLKDGQWSDVMGSCIIRTPAKDVLGMSPSDGQYDIQIYPNPYQSECTVAIHTGSDQMVEVTIFDTAGRLISAQHLTPAKEIKVGNGLPSGVYTFIVRQGELIRIFRIVKIE
ncbi:putative Ig domain-containing protein [Flavobacterium sp. AG291]|uniref:putative Ig domain-containing protein n=1 Tax=Flavobacterium sp. AG291 TaxID=2184000 RepID=UPI000E0C6F21|nr:putative Ig domain-containing protein [Flavobacterium sp. AG291]